MLAESNVAHGSLAQCMVSAPEKYRARQTGHSNAALHRPISEKNRDIWPNVVSPITFLKRTWTDEQFVARTRCLVIANDPDWTRVLPCKRQSQLPLMSLKRHPPTSDFRLCRPCRQEARCRCCRGSRRLSVRKRRRCALASTMEFKSFAEIKLTGN